MKLKVNKDSCVGCGACVASYEDLFVIGEDGLSQAKVDEVPEDKKEEAKESVGVCPTSAIEVEE